jgi:hypothetical protein
MVGKWKKMEKVFVAFLHLEVLILYILDMFWYVYFKYVLQCLAYVFISFATFFFWIIFLDNVLNVLCAWFPSSWMRCKDLQRLCLATFFFYWKLFSPACPPWQLHRLHVIRPHRCRPCTVGRHIHMKKKYRR